MSSSSLSPSRLPLFVLGLVLGAAATFGVMSFTGSSPTPSAPTGPVTPPPPSPSVATRTDRAPQLAEGTFTVWFMIAPGQEEVRAVASRDADGREVWVMTPSWVAPSASAPDVSLRIKFESPSIFPEPQLLLNWVGTKPALRPKFHGLLLKGYVHDTLVPWDGTQPRFCVP